MRYFDQSVDEMCIANGTYNRCVKRKIIRKFAPAKQCRSTALVCFRFPIHYICYFQVLVMSRRLLYTVSMLYLWLPMAIFLVGWTYWWVAVLPVLLGLWASIWPFRHLKGQVVFNSLWREVLIGALVLLWVISAGIGGWMWQDA